MQLYDLAILTVEIGSVPTAVEAISAWTGHASARGRLLGCWTSELGALNRIAVLRGYATEPDQEAEQFRLLHSASPFGCAGVLTALSVDRYRPFPDLPPIETGAFGPVYEVRTYTLKAGGLAPLMAAWSPMLPARMAASKLVTVMHTLDGPPRITHIWPYPDLVARAEIRADTVRRGIWPPKTSMYLSDMQSNIYLPTTISPLT